MTKKLFLITLLFLSVKLFAGNTQLSNFRIEDSQKSRVYFDSSTPLLSAISSTSGFSITGKTISGISVNIGATTGHYITVSSAFTFWDNNTIAYKGSNGINTVDRDYITNNIDEPTSSKTRYVNTSATGSGDGTSEENAWTFAQAVSSATSGMTVWVKAGNYGGGNYRFRSNGTAAHPIKFIGYQNSTGDNPDLKWSHPNNTGTNSSIMPLFENGKGDGLRVEASYVILRNFQVDNYDIPVRINGGRTGVIFDNIIAMNASRGNYTILNDQDSSKKCRLINSVGYVGGTTIVRWYGTQHLINNVTTIQPTGGVDYYIQIRGDYNIVRNSYMEHVQDAGHTGHGLSVKSVGVSTEYGLYENIEIGGIKLSIEARHNEVKFNVFRNINCFDNGVSIGNRGGINIMNGASNNIFDRITVDKGKAGIGFLSTAEKEDAPTAGYDNIIKNSIFKNNTYGIRLDEDSTGQNRETYNNYVINCTFYNNTYMFLNGSDDLYDNHIINSNIINTVKKEKISSSKPTGWDYQNSNFYNNNGFTVPTNNGNISVDPQFINALAGNFRLQLTSKIKDSGVDNEHVYYDADGVERTSGKYSIGAYDDAIPTVGSVSADVFICEGELATLVASGGDSYEWGGGETTSTIKVSPASTTTYTVTISDENNSDTHEIKVTVNELPTVDAGEDVTICDGDNIILTATGTGDFLWSTGETTSSITVSPDSTTTYSVTASNSCSTEVTDEVIVTVNPNVTLEVAGNVTICEGETITLTATGSGPFEWSTGETTASIDVSPTDTTIYTVVSSNGTCSKEEEVEVTVNKVPEVDAGEDVTICNGDTVTLTATGNGNFLWSTGETTSSITVAPNATTTYSVTASNSCSTEVIDEVIVTVNPNVTLDVGEDVFICEGETITLTATGSGPFEWSTGETTASIDVNPTKTTTYTVISSNGTCSKADDIKVTVNKAPTVNAGEDVTICNGETITLTATGNGNFLWSTGETTSRIAVSPNSTTTYTVTSSNSCSEEVSDEVIVTVNPKITLDAGEDVYVCLGEPVTLTATGSGPFEWSTGETTASIEVNPTKTTTYTVVSSNGTCSKTDRVKVIVNTPPTVDAGSDVSICEGDRVTLTAKGNGNFMWSTGETSKSISVKPNSTTTYTVTATTSSCVSTATDNITVSVSEKPSVIASDDITIEMGTSVTLTATGVGTFEWNTGEVGSSITVSPNVTTVYTVKATTEGGCTQSDKVVVTVVDSSGSGIVNAYAGEDVSVCLGKTIVLTASGGDRYLWSTGETERSITVKPKETVIYSVKVFTGENSATDHVTVFIDEKCTASLEKEMVVYPNPTQGQNLLNIDLTGFNDESNISLFNLKGVQVYSDSIDNHEQVSVINKQINLSRLPNGIYLVRLSNYGFVKTKKVIVNN